MIIATDGLDDVMSLDALNQFTENLSDWQPKWYIMELMKNIKKRKTQKDDIAVLVRFPSRE